GNVGSVLSAFNFYKTDAKLVSQPSDIDQCDLVVLAGVGNFKTAVDRLKSSGFWERLNQAVTMEGKTLLGICLGMQLFADLSFEGGSQPGFGWIKGKVIKIDDKSVRIPHMGWNKVQAFDNNIFQGMHQQYFYFMHSYHFVPEDKSVVVGTTKYGNTDIVAAVRHKNIIGVQFHPEKSQGDGLRLVRNLLEEIKC
ncbi:imidazole glycerol phosphate synthase subunit HisH, partial [bacterium]|nr:imidazole glycerol phosphate synthase subunit HisH [bacterium]